MLTVLPFHANGTMETASELQWYILIEILTSVSNNL
jgi:hypothetical protein